MIMSWLKKLFILHFLVDYIIAIPLMLAPRASMAMIGWQGAEPVVTRLVAAALLGIGGISFITRNADAAAYRHMLTMKLLWSGAAIVGLILSLIEGAPVATYAFLATFIMFFGIWLFFRLKI
jgi:cation transport ATPase